MNAWETLIESLLRASWQGGVMVLVVLLVQRILGARLAPRFRYLLWLPVAIRLALPLSVESSLSLFNWVPTPGAQDRPQMAAGGLIAEIQPARSVVEIALTSPSMDSRPDQPPPQTAEPTERATRVAMTPQRQPLTPMQMAAALWLAGLSIVTSFIWIPSFQFARRLRDAIPLRDPRVRQILSGCQDRMGVRQPVVVCETDCLKTPALFGVWRPRLLLPTGLAFRFSDSEVEHVFLHELAHLRRRDLMANWILTVLLVLHWFNPLVWLAMARIRIDRELACDALALMHVDERETQAYGETILKLVEAFSVGHGIPGLVGMGEDPGALRMRIGMIARFRRPGRWSALALVLVAGLGAVGLTDARRARTPAPPTPAAVPATENASLSDATRYRVQVIDERTKRPIVGAVVLTSSVSISNVWRRLSARTDASGLASLDLSKVQTHGDLPEVEMTIAHPGYAAVHVLRARRPDSAGRPEDYDLRVVLGQGRRIGGQILDASGKPVAGAKVYLWLPEVPWPTQASEPEAEIVPLPELSGWSWRTVLETDRSGHWHLDRAPDSSRRVEMQVVRKDGAQRLFATSHEEFDPDARQIVEMGSLVEGTAILHWIPGHDLDLTVVDEQGAPIPRASIHEHWRPLQFLWPQNPPGSTDALRLEGRSDRRGRVLLSDRAGAEKMIIASADGYALKFQIAGLSNGAPVSKATVVLQKVRPLKLRLTDEVGAPFAGAQLSTVYYGNHTAEMVPWSGVADGRGEVEWRNAPAGSFLLQIRSAGREINSIEVQPTRELQTFTVRPFVPHDTIELKVEAVDAIDGTPISRFEIRRSNDPGIFSHFEPLGTGREGRARAQLQNGGPVPRNTYRLKITSPGYQPFVSASPIRYSAGDQAFSVALKRATTPPYCTILQPDGRPAGGARLYRRSGQSAASFPEFGEPFAPQGYDMTEAGEEGELRLPADLPQTPVLVWHASGIAAVTLEALHHSKLTLSAWARVEVEWKSTDLNSTVVSCSLRSLFFQPGDLGLVLRFATSDQRGRVSFDHLPPGDYILQRDGGLRSRYDWVDQHSVRVNPGDNLRLVLGGDGVPVIGTLMRAEEPQPPATLYPSPPYLQQTAAAVLVRKQAPRPFPRQSDYASHERYWEAVLSHLKLEETKQHAREVRSYLINPAKDGSFRTENVRPGTYEIRTGVNGYTLGFRFPPRAASELGQLAGEVVIPDPVPGGSRSPIDLGVIIAARSWQAAASSPPLQIKGQDMQGRPLSLAGYRGRWVLLNLWSSWSERSLEAMPVIRGIRELSGDGSKFALIGISLDDDSSQARKVAEAQSMNWPQMTLTPEERGRLSQSLDLNGLPRSVLLDREGRVVFNDLAPGAALATLRRLIDRN